MPGPTVKRWSNDLRARVAPVDGVDVQLEGAALAPVQAVTEGTVLV